MIESFNHKKLFKISKDIPLEKIKKLLVEQFAFPKKVNIIFVDQEYIKELNKEFREKDEVTDVLSFNIDSSDTLGEIYICPEYVIKNISKKDFKEEIVRLIVHGILHLKGYDHKEEFSKVDYKREPMYIEQEEILNKILFELIQE